MTTQDLIDELSSHVPDGEIEVIRANPNGSFDVHVDYLFVNDERDTVFGIRIKSPHYGLEGDEK